ncbi:HD domain-containing phosphohydrolase [Noviherbaspirillum sp. UKPF54]|uniref:HD domain-containing phosphohydrolase n=1 Tax=Noviherbaspirillum sp. UKPF54 TaxID=2601898 RepID=UPI0011B19EB9|nr:HD domain-containing phosphohydrolase [Noviherbaspirillum sp. UKPF54]QDZ29958.1 HAMP domain-containing protein [Noviherbaspirillum sp. UKPF54]
MDWTTAKRRSLSARIAHRLGARLFPIRVYIGVLIIGLMLISGFCIGLYNYAENTQLLLKTGNVLFERARQATRLTVSNLFAPTQMLVNLLSQQQVTRAGTLQERLDNLPYLVEALNQHPPLSALYVGNERGDFFLVRPLRTEAQRIAWQAPIGTFYVVQHVDRSRVSAPVGTYLFFDAALRLIERRDEAGYHFDPRVRPWYRQAWANTAAVVTDPYVFYSTREPGMTVARRASGSVVGADITLAALTDLLVRVKMSPSAQLMLLDTDENVLAYSDAGATVTVENGVLRLPQLKALKQTVLMALLRQPEEGKVQAFEYRQEAWIGFADRFAVAGHPLLLAMAAPRAELLAHAERVRRNEAVLTIFILILATPVAWLASLWIARPLQRLADDARAVQAFDFGRPVERSWIREVDQLATSMGSMKSTISRFLDLSASLSSERHVPALLEKVLAESAGALHAAGGGIYLNEEVPESYALAVSHGAAPGLPREISLADAGPDGAGPGRFSRLCGAAIHIRGPLVSERPEGEGLSAVVPLFNHEGEAIGLLALFLARQSGPPSAEKIGFVTALSGTAAIAIEAQRLLEKRKALLQSLVELIATAIDTKSPYTGGHCQRVPVIAKMLAKAACDTDEGPFRHFSMDDDAWEALHLGAWLHDCGKVTTPEYVVDKATKLETLYDRIHEVRMRFEVLKRDAQIAYWQELAQGGHDGEAALARDLETALRALDEDFAFVAQCNVGGESMSDEQIARLRRIAQRTWVRTLDDRIGISRQEAERKARSPAPALPVTEPLLADRPWHLIRRLPQDIMPPDNPWGFKVNMPTYKYNQGEVYNLCVRRGTLSKEERYKIGDHVVQTYMMLSRLPFPPHLRSVPDIAGGHHEKLDGSGYPRRLHAEQMSLPMRMVAIADVFEALTAADRPYKPGKPLSETLALMARMRDERHIDADLFELFLTGGVYREYALAYLLPEQIDVSDITPFLH